ncbi:MAG TPA: hypothetical protein VGD30_12195 [Telluria sp.]
MALRPGVVFLFLLIVRVVALSKFGFETWAEASEVRNAFARYMSAMAAVLKWEAAEVNRIATPRVGLTATS